MAMALRVQLAATAEGRFDEAGVVERGRRFDAVATNRETRSARSAG
jgi:hypothetical protein